MNDLEIMYMKMHAETLKEVREKEKQQEIADSHIKAQEEIAEKLPESMSQYKPIIKLLASSLYWDSQRWIKITFILSSLVESGNSHETKKLIKEFIHGSSAI